MTDVIAVFPGQGAQQVSMLSELAEQYSIVKQTFNEASSAVDVDLWQLSQSGPAEVLNQTSNTQPALLAASVACFRLVKELYPQLNVVAAAGHSLGEYSALVAAGALSFSDAVVLVRRRGQLMESAVPAGEGGMAAILGLDRAKIEELCQEASDVGVVEPANFNAPGQVVISGAANAIEKAITIAKSSGAKRAMPLAVSGPFHSSLMQPAAEDFADVVGAVDWQSAAFPVIHNVTNKSADRDDIAGLLCQQLYHSVDWIGAVTNLAATTSNSLPVIEFGPGRVLSGLIKRCDKAMKVYATQDLASIENLASIGLGE